MSIIDRNRLKTPIRGRAETGDGVFNYVYVDLRRVVGHYLEFVYIDGVPGGPGKALEGA